MARAIFIIMNVIIHKANNERPFRGNKYKECNVYRRNVKLEPTVMERQCNSIFQKLFFENVNKRTEHPTSRKYVAGLYEKYFGKNKGDKLMNEKENYPDNCLWFAKKIYKEEMKKLKRGDLYERVKLYPQEFMYFMCRKMVQKFEELGMKKEKEAFLKTILNRCKSPHLQDFKYSLENNKRFPISAPKDKTNNKESHGNSSIYTKDRKSHANNRRMSLESRNSEVCFEYD